MNPLAFTSKSKIASHLLKQLSLDNLVASVSWLNDLNYLQNKDNNYYMNFGNIEILTFPIETQIQKASIQFYQIQKALNAQTVISVGDINDVEFMAGMKTLSPNSFKWIHYLTNFDQTKIEVLKLMDKIIPCNLQIQNELSHINIQSQVIEFFPQENQFKNLNLKERQEKFTIMNSSKNNSISNLGCFIEAVSIVKNKIDNFNVYLHTEEQGDLDIKSLIKKYNCEDIIGIPQKYLNFQDGLSQEEYIIKLNQAYSYIDCSCLSSTHLRLKQAQLCGCNTVSLNNFNNYKIDSYKYISYNNIELQMASSKDLANVIYLQYLCWKYNKNDLNVKFDTDFIFKIKKVIEESLKINNEIKLEQI